MWTASNFIVAGMESGEDGWNKPFLCVLTSSSESTVKVADLRKVHISKHGTLCFIPPSYILAIQARTYTERLVCGSFLSVEQFSRVS